MMKKVERFMAGVLATEMPRWAARPSGLTAEEGNVGLFIFLGSFASEVGFSCYFAVFSVGASYFNTS